GYARLVKLLELLAGYDPAAAGVLTMTTAAWCEWLSASPGELRQFFEHLGRSGWLTYSQDDGSITVDLLKADDFLPGPVPVLFSAPEQWAFWCETELNMPHHVTGDPYTLQLFRRWCASNVTVTEMQQACELAAQGQPDLSPTALHGHLSTVRRHRLEQARV
ncbi:hypothetical protein, partial [Pseudomonas sp. NMI795_08]|uniref:hypothetical protein n=1 Tax=Pseudomonas sp. NMI795_08 TaxID=2903144 RepID=UPI001E535107